MRPLLTWVLFFVSWAGFFWLFWNVKRWHWSVAKIVGIAFACALAAVAAAIGVGFIVVTLFD